MRDITYEILQSGEGQSAQNFDNSNFDKFLTIFDQLQEKERIEVAKIARSQSQEILALLYGYSSVESQIEISSYNGLQKIQERELTLSDSLVYIQRTIGEPASADQAYSNTFNASVLSIVDIPDSDDEQVSHKNNPEIVLLPSTDAISSNIRFSFGWLFTGHANAQNLAKLFGIQIFDRLSLFTISGQTIPADSLRSNVSFYQK